MQKDKNREGMKDVFGGRVYQSQQAMAADPTARA
jgi:hypothetical protein